VFINEMVANSVRLLIVFMASSFSMVANSKNVSLRVLTTAEVQQSVAGVTTA
jgi:hypothetical protein